jgi:hypothetical protein
MPGGHAQARAVSGRGWQTVARPGIADQPRVAHSTAGRHGQADIRGKRSPEPHARLSRCKSAPVAGRRRQGARRHRRVLADQDPCHHRRRNRRRCGVDVARARLCHGLADLPRGVRAAVALADRGPAFPALALLGHGGGLDHGGHHAGRSGRPLAGPGLSGRCRCC